MQKVEFPKWKYHAEFEPRIVGSAADERSLGAGWVDSPADVIATIPAHAASHPKKKTKPSGVPKA